MSVDWVHLHCHPMNAFVWVHLSRLWLNLQCCRHYNSSTHWSVGVYLVYALIICPIYKLHYQICKSLVWYGMYSLYQQKSMSTWIFNMIFLCIVWINKFMVVSVFYMSVNLFMSYVFAILPRIWLWRYFYV